MSSSSASIVRAPAPKDMIAALVLLKSMSTILVIGKSAREYQATIEKCMDPYSRLVVNLPPGSLADPEEPHHDSDLRVALHCQDTSSFLHDIQSHKLDLVLADGSDLTPELANQIIEMLPESGCLAVLNGRGAFTGACMNALENGKLVDMDAVILFIKATEREARKRKGGRRGRRLPDAASQPS